MQKKITYTALIILIAVVVGMSIFLTKAQDSVHENELYTKAMETNNSFLSTFFNYTSTKSRYENIAPFMTKQGYASTYPSGLTIPEDTGKLVSSMKGLKVYQSRNDQEKPEFISEFQVTTSYDGIPSTENIRIYTALIEEDGQWKINAVEVLDDQPAGEEEDSF